MKILISSFTYFPNVDGVAAAAGQMAEIFQSAGHQVKIATSELSALVTSSASTDTENIHRFKISGTPALGAGFQGETGAYLDFIAGFCPDMIFFHCWDVWTAELAMPLMAALRCKSVLVSHGYASHVLELAKLPRGIVKWLRWLPHVCTLPFRIRRFDRVVFLSHKTDWGRFFDARMARLTRACNTTVIPNGVPELPASVPGRFRQAHGIGPGPMFLCIANYTGRKNQERALRAFAATELQDATLVFIGSKLGDYGIRMVSLWRELKSSGAAGRVLFLEGLARDETLSALRDCDVKILAADAETQPIVLLEAMAASKPFISTRTGCVEEFKGGLIVRDAAEMARAMCALAASPADRESLGAAGRHDYEEHYSLKSTSQSWLGLLGELSCADPT